MALTEEFNFMPDRNLLGAILSSTSDAERLVSLRDVFGKGKVVVVEPHPDDAVISMGVILRKILELGSTVEMITVDPDHGGVTNEFISQWFLKSPSGLNEASNGREDTLRRHIREMESRDVLRRIGIDASYHTSLDISMQPGQGQSLEDRKIPFPPLLYPEMTDEEREIIRKSVEKHIDAPTWILSFPFLHSPHHNQHEAATLTYLYELYRHGYKGDIVFYETFEAQTDFDREDIVPSFSYAFSAEEMALKTADIGEYRSQEIRRPDGEKYAELIVKRNAAYARIEYGRVVPLPDGGMRARVQPPQFVERFIIGRLFPASAKTQSMAGRWPWLMSINSRLSSAVSSSLVPHYMIQE
jgi:hypothetical protein